MKHLLILVLFLGGCTEYWYQPGVSWNEASDDLEQCYRSLSKYSELQYYGSYEQRFVKQCMEGKGYSLYTEKELPMDVRRVGPDISLHWQLKGIAGEIDPNEPCEKDPLGQFLMPRYR